MLFPDSNPETSSRIPRPARLLAALLLATFVGVACRGRSTPPQPIPTLDPDQPQDSVTATPSSQAADQPVHDASLALDLPAIVPGDGGEVVACPDSALTLPLTFPGVEGEEAFGAASRIAASGEFIYLVLDGGLYRADRLAVHAGTVDLRPLLAPGADVDGRVVHEIADIALDEVRGLLYALDKAGHIYRYTLESGRASLAFQASPYLDFTVFPQMIALTVDGLHRPVVLDTVYGALWTPLNRSELEIIAQDESFVDGADLSFAGGLFYIMHRDGRVSLLDEDLDAHQWLPAGQAGLPLSLFMVPHLGIDHLYMVDALGRAVLGFVPGASGDAMFRAEFAFPEMGLLQDAAFADGRIYAVADSSLIIYPGRAGDECEPLAPADYAQPLLYGVDVIATLDDLTFPIEDGNLPDWPRLYPGASRIYRLGVHEGIDIFFWDGPYGFGTGWPVVAMGAGRVVRATVDYVPMTVSEYDLLIRRALSAGQTPDDVLTRLAGMQIVIDHGGGLRTVYSHLNSIEDGIEEGDIVRPGDPIGTVGSTGTQGEVEPGEAYPHLHFEIWLGDRYLGSGITITETIWWLTQAYDM